MARGESNHSNPFCERRRRASYTAVDGSAGWARERSERRPFVRHRRCRVWLSGAPAGGGTLRSDRRRDVTTAHGTRARTRTHTKLTRRRRPTHITEFPPPTDTAVLVRVAAGGQGGGERINAHDARSARRTFSSSPSARLPATSASARSALARRNAHTHTAAARRRRRYSYALRDHRRRRPAPRPLPESARVCN